MPEKNIVQYGLEDIYYAPVTAVTSTGYTYATPVKLDGAVNLNLEADGEIIPIYADNVEKTSIDLNRGYTGELEILIADDTFKAAVLGQRIVNGILHEGANDKPVEFALAYTFSGDVMGTRHWFYRCKCSRPAIGSGTTGQSVEPVHDTLSFTARPRVTDKETAVHCPNTTALATIYSNWFTAVYEEEDEE
jgi:phi13 family phage major tail protein